MTKYDFDSNGIARVYDDGKWYLIDRTEKRVSDGYTYIEEWGEGYYKVTIRRSWEQRRTSCDQTEA